MKKIGIVTITKNPNYGNALQMIALQIALKRIGCQPETIINYDGSSLFKKATNFKYYIKVLMKCSNRKFEIRRRRFLQCLKNHVRFSDTFYRNGVMHRFNNDSFDYVIVGSDQVWNPFFGLASPFEMLSFVPESKRVAYAASFGVTNLEGLENDKLNLISESLKHFRAVSVREKAGARIVNDLSGLKAEVCLDPTMLITSDEWDVIIEKPMQVLPERYIVVYMLGELTEEYEKEITAIAKERNAAVINLLSDEFFLLNPLEFVWMLKNSLFVCTDSFHASVFSIIYHKAFRIFDRKDKHENQNSRFDTLLEKCGIIANGVVDWKCVEEKLSYERENSINYLKKLIIGLDELCE